MAMIKLIIGAALDGSVQASYDQVVSRANKANAAMRAGSQRASKEQLQQAQRTSQQQVASSEKAAQAQAKAVERINAQIARTEARAAAEQDRRRQAGVKADQRAFDQRLKASQKASQAEERDIMRVAAATERADAKKREAADRDRARNRSMFAREFGHRAVSNLAQTARFGMGIAGQIARGAGVNLDISASAARNVELERQAIDLSNSGYDPNAKPGTANSRRVDAADITKDVKEAADANAFSRTEAMAGLQSFVGKTGDLDTGRRVIKDLGALSRATGTDLGDMVDAAGDAANALGDMGKGEAGAKRISAVMKSIAGQGKLGAVEIKDLATQMAKLGAGATAFEGDAGENIALMGAFAQLARQKGGATSANIAAGSVTSMVNTLKTPARMKAFEAEGISVVNKETGMLRNPQQILMAALAKTGGDPERLKKMYANVQGARAIEGSATTFRQERAKVMAAGGTEAEATAAGLKAVAEEFDRLKKVAMGEGEIRESLNRALSSQSAKAQQFNNRMDDVTANMQAKLAPALERAAPAIIKLADWLSGKLVDAVDNPGKAIAAAIVASIAKAGIETAVSNGLAGLLKRVLGGGGAPVPGGAPGGAPMGTAGKALSVLGAAAVGFGVGKELHDADADAADRAESRNRTAATSAENARGALRMSTLTSDGSDASIARQRAALGEGQRALGDLEAHDANANKPYWNGYVSAAANFVTMGSVGSSLDQQNQIDADSDKYGAVKRAAQESELKGEMANVAAALKGTLTVRVANMPQGGFVDPNGRQPPPAPPP